MENKLAAWLVDYLETGIVNECFGDDDETYSKLETVVEKIKNGGKLEREEIKLILPDIVEFVSFAEGDNIVDKAYIETGKEAAEYLKAQEG